MCFICKHLTNKKATHVWYYVQLLTWFWQYIFWVTTTLNGESHIHIQAFSFCFVACNVSVINAHSHHTSWQPWCEWIDTFLILCSSFISSLLFTIYHFPSLHLHTSSAFLYPCCFYKCLFVVNLNCLIHIVLSFLPSLYPYLCPLI